MSLLLDALKEAEKSRKGLETAPKATSVVTEEPAVLDLELDQTEVSRLEGLTSEEPQPEAPLQEEPAQKEASTPSTPSNDSGNTTVAPETPAIKPTTVPPTLQHRSIKDTRVATDVFQNREYSKKQTKSRLSLLLLILLLVLLGLLAMFFFAMNNGELPPTKPFNHIQNTLSLTAEPQTDLTNERNLNKEAFSNNSSSLHKNSVQDVSMISEKLPVTVFQQEVLMEEINSPLKNVPIHNTQPAAPYKNQPATRETNNKQPTSGRESNRNDLSSNPDFQITKRQLPEYSLTSLTSASDALKQGNLTSAEQIYRQVLKQSPNNVEAMAGLATAFVQQGLIREGQGMFYEVLNKDPGNLLAKIGLINLQAADPSNLSAGSQLKQLLLQHPKQADLHASLGNFYARRGEWPSAQASYFEAFALDTKNPDHAFNLAVSLDQIGKSDIAIKYYEQALGLVETNPSRFNKTDAERRLHELKGHKLKGIAP
ncbi:MAG: tetratricopeptide repeat protein [Porticoccus sp.]|nr:tetratricopeptide repeat protein [Porticoccus sp.]